jgi:hypothetical protein
MRARTLPGCVSKAYAEQRQETASGYKWARFGPVSEAGRFECVFACDVHRHYMITLFRLKTATRTPSCHGWTTAALAPAHQYLLVAPAPHHGVHGMHVAKRPFKHTSRNVKDTTNSCALPDTTVDASTWCEQLQGVACRPPGGGGGGGAACLHQKATARLNTYTAQATPT